MRFLIEGSNTSQAQLGAAQARVQHRHTHLEYRRKLWGEQERAYAAGRDPRDPAWFQRLMIEAEAEYLVALDLLWGVQTRVNP